jgi:hypothetical protein
MEGDMHAKLTTLGTSPVRGVDGLYFEPRGAPTASKVVAVAIAAAILLAILV